MTRGVYVVIVAAAACTLSHASFAAPPRPVYGTEVGQINDAGRVQNQQGDVLSKIRQESQTCKMIDVKILQRNLKVGPVPMPKVVPEMSHVQAFAFAVETDNVYDSWGVGNDDGKIVLLREPIELYDEKNVLGEYRISSEGYDHAKRSVETLLKETDYELANNVNIKKNVLDGMSAGFAAGKDIGMHEGRLSGLVYGLANGIPGGTVLGAVGATLAGTVGGGIAGVVYSLKKYRENRHNAMIESDQERQRNYLGLNCHLGIDVLVEFSKLEPGFELIKQYKMPGEVHVDSTGTSTGGVDLHTLDLDNPNGDWCKCETPGCWENTIGVRCICTKCGKVNVEYSRKALAMEARLKAEGKEGSWHMDRSEAVKAAQGK